MTNQKQSLQPVDLTNCDKEQIHIPGSVQSFGALIAFDANLRINRVSDNIEAFTGFAPAQILGKPLTELLDFESEQKITSAEDGAWQIYSVELKSGKTVDILSHFNSAELFIELFDPATARKIDANSILRNFVSESSKAKTIQDLVEILARTVRAVSGIDRVKIYQFDQDWNGEVIAEARDPEMPSYLGLHFPQADIPKQARELYQRNKVRVIADVNSAQSPIIDNGKLRPIDLSFAFSRTVSEIHLQYLRNMNVLASMSLSIFDGSRFWGLVACHHRTAKDFNPQEAALYEALVEVTSSRLTDLNKVVTAEIKAENLVTLQTIVRNVTGNGELDTLISGRLNVRDLVMCTGAILSFDGQVIKQGSVPDEATVSRLLTWLDRGVGDLVAYDDLPSRFSGDIGTYACGIMAARIGSKPKSWLIWMRQEFIDEVSWAGDPYKPTEESPFGARLYPRTSFELWKETSRGRSKPWLETEQEAARILAESIINLTDRGIATAAPR